MSEKNLAQSSLSWERIGWIGLQAGEGVGGALGTTGWLEPSGPLSAGLPPSLGPAMGRKELQLPTLQA